MPPIAFYYSIKQTNISLQNIWISFWQIHLTVHYRVPQFQIFNSFSRHLQIFEKMLLLLIEDSSPNNYCQNGVVQLRVVSVGVVQKGVDLLLQKTNKHWSAKHIDITAQCAVHTMMSLVWDYELIGDICKFSETN